jgi:hypothetical protein
MQRRLEEFLAIVKRDVGAEEAELFGPGEEPPAAPGWIAARLPEGMSVAARLPVDRDVAAPRERLGALVEAFRLALQQAPHPPSTRPARSELLESLHAELVGLAAQAGARDALLIDAHSPVVWATTETDARTQHERFLRSAACFRAVAKLRAMPIMAELHKGAHLHEHASGPGFGYFALSFASIYVAVLVYEGTPDELRSRRALAHALPAIERLLVALPPLEPGGPTPVAKVVAMRGVRRRR